MADVKVVIRTVDQGSKEVTNFGKKLEGVLDVVTKSAAAAAAAGAVFKQAFDLSNEGAQISQLRDSFELMNAQVFKTPDLLENMSEAVKGTIKDTDLMKSLLTLTAGAGNEAAQAYAAAAPQLLEIAKASNKLNPALGDTAFLFDSLALGIKRGSPLILDNLGLTIKIGEANETYAKQLGKSVEQLTAEEKQMALLNATLAAGDTLIAQVGGNVDSQADAWARLSVKVSEGTDSFKEFLANGLNPVVSAMAGDYGNEVENIIDDNLSMAMSFDELVAEAQRMNDVNALVLGLGTTFTGTTNEIRDGLVDVAGQLAGTAGGFEEFEAVIESWNNKSQGQFKAFIQTQGLTIEEFYEQERAAYAVAQAIEELVPATVMADQNLLRMAGTLVEVEEQTGLSTSAIIEYSAAMAEARGVNEELADKQGQLANQTGTVEQAVLAANLANQQAIETMREEAEAAAELQQRQADYFMTAVEGKPVQDDLNNAIFESARASGASAEQLAILGGALGIYSDEAVEAALKSALIQTKIDALAASYVAGNISVEEMRTGLQNFIAELDGVSGEAGETGGAIEELSEKMASLPTSHEFVIKITQDGEIPTIPNGPQGKGGDPTKMSGGGLVTGGVPGKDSVWKLLMPGERVLNTAQTQEWNRGSKGDSGAKSINIPINVTVQGGGDPDAIANAIQAKFMATARARGL